jgi:hypothetical protein
MSTPTQEYGWVIIPPEKHKEFEPPQKGDELWLDASSHWEARWAKPGTPFNLLYTYRRRIDPGEGWEIVPENECPCNTEQTRDGVNWMSFGDIVPFETVREALACGYHGNILAFRRKSDGWVRFAAIFPESGRDVWICHIERKEIRFLRAVKPECVNTAYWPHWRYAEGQYSIPPLPQPELTPAEKAWNALESKPADAKAAFVVGFEKGGAK